MRSTENKNDVDATSTWRYALKQRWFRTAVTYCLLIMILLIFVYPSFFLFIEQRPGMQLNDHLLASIPPVNVSVLIFLMIWGAVLLTIWRTILHPAVFITVLAAYTMLSVIRVLSLYLVALESPPGLIVLIDPLTNYFYGNTFITKDLFFSGHTATVFLFALHADKRWLKYLLVVLSILLGILLLIQHVHYTVDVLVAFPAAYVAQWVSLSFLDFTKKKKILF